MITHTFGNRDSTGTAVGISPCGKVMVTAGDDYRVHFWSLPKGALIASRDGHKRMVKSFAFSGDGQWLASGDFEGAIRIWKMPSMSSSRTWTGHSDAIFCMSMSDDGGFLVTGDQSGNVVLWDVPKTKEVGKIPGRGQSASSVILTKSGDTILMSFSGEGRIYCWTPGTSQLNRFATKGDSVSDLSINSSGTLAAAKTAYWVQLISFPGEQLIRQLDPTGSATVAITDDDKFLVVGDETGIRLWPLPGCENAIILDEHKRAGYTGRFVLGDGGRILAGTTLVDGETAVRVWSIHDQQVLFDAKDISYAYGILEGGKVLLSGKSGRSGGEKGFTLTYLGELAEK